MNHTALRRLRYRLKTQGMCELDAWLAPLADALTQPSMDMIQHVEQLLKHEVPELQAMMHGRQTIPNALQPWLNPVIKNKE